MKPKIFMLLGDGGALFSGGFSAYGDRLQSMGYDVKRFADSGRYTTAVCTGISAEPPERKIALIGYSLGGNGCAWVADALRKRDIDLLVAFDPTRRGLPLSQFPLDANVKRAICFVQTSRISPTTWLFGGGVLERTPNGPQIEVHETKNDHMLLQWDRSLQDICTEAIQQLEAPHVA